MAWGTIPLNDGTHIPALAFGTWKRGKGDEGIGRMKQALETGIAHLDTAQAYRNELETGAAIPASGREREDVYVTTKFASLADLDASIRTSCGELGVDYVDLYLVHGPRHAQPDIPTFWKRMEAIRDAGLAKSIGVSNFTVQQLESLLASAKVKPVVNQVCIHPQVMHIQAPLLAFCAEHDIVIEGYSPCIPLEYYPEGACARLATSMGKRFGVKPEQVLLAWAKAKGVVVVTSSGRKERLQDYVAAGDIELTAEDVAAIDAAGLSEPKALPW